MLVIRTSYVVSALLLFAVNLRAEIVSFSGDVEAVLEERIDGQNEQLDSASERFPGTSSELPIQAIV
ncbi:MAG: hypothetical protein AB7N71_10040, partial [Phycisphaerae bacterium]